MGQLFAEMASLATAHYVSLLHSKHLVSPWQGKQSFGYIYTHMCAFIIYIHVTHMYSTLANSTTHKESCHTELFIRRVKNDKPWVQVSIEFAWNVSGNMAKRGHLESPQLLGMKSSVHYYYKELSLSHTFIKLKWWPYDTLLEAGLPGYCIMKQAYSTKEDKGIDTTRAWSVQFMLYFRLP